jgi:hypothetical protein
MSVYFNIISSKGEKTLEFWDLPDFWAYFKKWRDKFKHYPRKTVVYRNGIKNYIFEYNALEKEQRQNCQFVFRYFDLNNNCKINYFESYDELKHFWESYDIQDEKPKVERKGDKVIFTYREDRLYQGFAAQKTASYSTFLPTGCSEVRFVWIDQSGEETIKEFENLAEFWEFFDSISCQFEPVEFYDEDDEVMNYIYDVNELQIKGTKKRSHKTYYHKAISDFGSNPNQRVIY